MPRFSPSVCVCTRDVAYESILKVTRTGVQWRQLQPKNVSSITVFKTMHKWIAADLVRTVYRRLLRLYARSRPTVLKRLATRTVTVLLDEYRTSKQCPCELTDGPRASKSASVSVSTRQTGAFAIFWHRDVVATVNMLLATQSVCKQESNASLSTLYLVQ